MSMMYLSHVLCDAQDFSIYFIRLFRILLSIGWLRNTVLLVPFAVYICIAIKDNNNNNEGYQKKKKSNLNSENWNQILFGSEL